MAEEVTSGEVRTRRFDIVRKGYDRTQVDEFLAAVARRIDQLEESIEGADRAATALGLDDAEALARELDTIGGEVAAILEAARAAAEGMRTRAAADAEELRVSSQESSSTMVSEATEQAHSMRAAAWNEGSSMLQSALAEAKALVEEAREDALLIRAEAEREAIRHVSDAKRDRDATIGEARIEADHIIQAARAESDGVLAAANQAAELAQERARALEERRSELLAELETARASIGHLETEIESKRQELVEPDVPDVLEVPAEDDRTHHSPDGGSVKIVSAAKVVSLNPVDADSFVAEVEALHRRDAESAPDVQDTEPVETVAIIAPTPVVAGRTEDERREMEPELHVVPEPTPETVPVPEAVPALEPVPEPEVDDGRQMTDVRPAGAELEADDRRQTSDDRPEGPEGVGLEPEADDRRQTTDDRPAGAEPEADDRRQTTDDRPEGPEGVGLVPEPESAPVPKSEDDLGALFAQLRSGVEPPVEGTPHEPSEPSEPSSPTADGRQPTADSGASDEPLDESPAAPSLIPAQNAALRTIKRALVDLQNDTLEHLRSEEGWLPDEAFTNRFAEPFSELATAVGAPDDKGAASAFGTDLYDSVTSAIERARDAGSGERAVAAAASKVFRTWRSDEAERRVVAVATSLAQDSSSP